MRAAELWTQHTPCLCYKNSTKVSIDFSAQLIITPPLANKPLQSSYLIIIETLHQREVSRDYGV
jgi:hypothetical protein